MHEDSGTTEYAAGRPHGAESCSSQDGDGTLLSGPKAQRQKLTTSANIALTWSPKVRQVEVD